MRHIPFLLMLTAMICLAAPSLSGQSAFDPVFHEEASRVGEELEVFTDRSLYVVNERIRFRADYLLEGLEDMPWSDVLYLELVSARGHVIAKAKYPITGGVSRGGLTIPPEMETGNYYLKCYTRWMRNNGPASFSYVPVKIINPFRTEVTEYINTIQEVLPLERTPYEKGLLKIESPARSFNRNEEVRFTLSAPDSRFTETLHCCVSIVPLEAIDTLQGPYTGSTEQSGPPGFSLNYLPDLGGASISGRVLHNDGTPGAYATLHFTLLGSDPGYYVTASDEQGRFAISTLNSTGEYEVFVAAKPYEEHQVEVRIDQDFDQTELQLPDHKFAFSETEREVARRMAIRMQLSRTFDEETTENPLESNNPVEDTIPFYGNPGFHLDLGEFVDLPSLTEVFDNLVPVVTIVKRRGIRYFSVEAENNTTALYPPLVMIDHIPVFDQEAVMTLVPEKIRRIEVINELYIKGNVTFGGVISILSWKGDMAGIDLPQGSYFFDFQALEPMVKEEALLTDPGERIPDTRNTLLWMDDLKLEWRGSKEFSCVMPDQPGDYVVLLRGVTPGGEVHAATSRFRVE